MITPGKWEYTEGLSEIVAIDAAHGDSLQIAIIQHNDADGILMAAAPELLEMLKQARCYVASFAANRDDARAEAVRNDVDAAIARAEGK